MFLFSTIFFHLGTSPLPLSGGGGGGGGGNIGAELVDYDSEDLSPTPSLDEISSDELSWLDDRDCSEYKKHQLQTVKTLLLSKQPKLCGRAES